MVMTSPGAAPSAARSAATVVAGASAPGAIDTWSTARPSRRVRSTGDAATSRPRGRGAPRPQQRRMVLEVHRTVLPVVRDHDAVVAASADRRWWAGVRRHPGRRSEQKVTCHHGRIPARI
jgi:hypothetical protein